MTNGISSAIRLTVEQNVTRYRFLRRKWPDRPSRIWNQLSGESPYHQDLIDLVIFYFPLHLLKAS